MSEIVNQISTTTPCVWIKKLKFSDGTEIELNKDDVVVIVGPNNSGKSACLRGIRDLICVRGSQSKVISGIETQKEGTHDDLLSWLDTFTIKVKQDANNPVYQAYQIGFSLKDSKLYWERKDICIDQMGRLFCYLLNADERLSGSKPADNIAIAKEPSRHPIHYLYQNDKLEANLSNQFRKAFGLDLIVHRSAGSVIPLLTGERPVPGEGQDRVSYEYIQKLEGLDQLQNQGDGMRSFASIVLFTMVGKESILLVDEPEAFLHPPQARLIGKMLVSEKPAGRQLFIATHSGDVLRGVLDANSPRVRVLRIRRTESVNTVKELNSNSIQELWRDPLLRYSNILDGLFHERVVVAEGDSDARFYSAVLDAIWEKKSSDRRRPDIMFTHCGGKDRMPMVIRALRAVEVPIRAVADIDLINNKHPLQAFVEASGGNWDEFKQDWNIVKSQVDSKKAELSTSEVKRQINELLDVVNEKTLPTDVRPKIESILKQSSPWAIVKEAGKAYIPPGDATQAFSRLVAALQCLGIWLVEVGQLECFCRSVGNHGPLWVNAVLQKDLANDHELSDARSFVENLIL